MYPNDDMARYLLETISVAYDLPISAYSGTISVAYDEGISAYHLVISYGYG